MDRFGEGRLEDFLTAGAAAGTSGPCATGPKAPGRPSRGSALEAHRGQPIGPVRLPTGGGQRLGRILRPKAGGGQASFYTVVARETADQAFAANRQRFLSEQGYASTILDAEEVFAGA